MPGYVLIIDVFGVILAVVGFCMAFRQTFVRRLIGRPHMSGLSASQSDDPLTYILRIAGVMIMVFGIVIGGMFTLFNLG
ncbi:MAG: hypothetical protein H6917_15350 [Novosphingobium sp.]|nr:hypothetical protein [Novosphingobium sp.]